MRLFPPSSERNLGDLSGLVCVALLGSSERPTLSLPSKGILKPILQMRKVERRAGQKSQSGQMARPL